MHPSKDAANDPPDSWDEESAPPQKLDLGYFTQPNLCPQMVRKKARRSFELFLYLARSFLDARGEPVSPTHEQLCRACGIVPESPHARSIVSRLLRGLRTEFNVIDFQPQKRRRPQIRLLPATPKADILAPKQYVYFGEGWNDKHRALFATLGPRAFAAEFMYFAARYESAFASKSGDRPYWFFPQEKMAAIYHVSARFAGIGLRGLVELGVMHVTPGQFGITAPNDEFGRANRYYFEGLNAVYQRHQEFGQLRTEHASTFDLAYALAGELTNGPTRKNVEGLCELLASSGEPAVRRAIQRLTVFPKRSLKRRLPYLAALCRLSEN